MKKKMLWAIIAICLVAVFVCGLGSYFLLKNASNLLIVNEEPKPSDVIIVLEGGNDRVAEGVSLYQSGNADKILFTGGAGTHDMARYALSLGVTLDHLIIEDTSCTTFGNAKNSLEVMQTQGFKSAIVVTSPYHTRRASIIFHQIFRGLDLTICSVPYDNNWWKNRRNLMAVTTEYMKLVYHYLFER